MPPPQRSRAAPRRAYTSTSGPDDLVADSLRGPRQPGQPRTAWPAVQIDHQVVTLPPQAPRQPADRPRSARARTRAARRSLRPGADCRRTTGSAAGSTRYVRCASGNLRFNARSIGVVNTTSPIRRRRISRIFTAAIHAIRNRIRTRNPNPGSRFGPGSRTVSLWLYRRLVDQHDRNVVLDWVDALALRTSARCRS